MCIFAFGINLSEVHATEYGDFKYSVLGDNTIEIKEYVGNATSLEIPENIEGKAVTNIGISAFSGCSSLTKITIPNGVTNIEAGAFSSCSSLTEINVDSNNKKYSSEDGVLYNKEKNSILICPNAKTDIKFPNDCITFLWEHHFDK